MAEGKQLHKPCFNHAFQPAHLARFYPQILRPHYSQNIKEALFALATVPQVTVEQLE